MSCSALMSLIIFCSLFLILLESIEQFTFHGIKIPWSCKAFSKVFFGKYSWLVLHSSSYFFSLFSFQQQRWRKKQQRSIWPLFRKQRQPSTADEESTETKKKKKLIKSRETMVEKLMPAKKNHMKHFRKNCAERIEIHIANQNHVLVPLCWE